MLAEIIICIDIPLLFFNLILKKEIRPISLYLFAGTVACYLACLINTWLMSELGCTFFYLTTTVAPITEEFLKFLPILLMSFLSKDDMEKIFPTACALGIGFAITENLYMLSENPESASISWLVLRGISTGLMHTMSAAVIALGISEAEKYKELSFVGIIATLSLAMIYHGFFNCMVNSEGIMKYIGVTIPTITYAIVFLTYKMDVVKKVLASITTDEKDE